MIKSDKKVIKSDKKVIKSDKYAKLKIPGEGMVYHQVELDITDFHRNNGTWNLPRFDPGSEVQYRQTLPLSHRQ